VVVSVVMKAIVYIRVSSEEQVNGNGLERQLETVTSYCRQNGLQIVQTIKDEGKSASKGKHINGGELGKLLSAIRSGTYRKHALVIEYLDRLSRQGFEQTFAILSDLRKNEVELHEAKNNRVIRSLDDLGTGILTIVDAYQAKEYSAKLSERIGKAWRKKRENVIRGEALTRKCPAWLTVVPVLNENGKVETRKFQKNAEMVAVVQEMFDLAAQGVGSLNIFKKLNGRLHGLSRSWINTTLANRAVLGQYKSANGDLVQLYPQIVSQSVFDAARLAISARVRHNKKVRGGRYNSDRVDNLFSGLVYDITEGDPRPMHYQRVTKRGQVLSAEYLRTEQSGDGRKPHSIRYQCFEHEILSFLESANWKAIAGSTESDEYKHAVAQLEGVLGEIDKARRVIAHKTEAMEDPALDMATLKVFASQIAKAEAAIATLTEQKEALQTEVDTARAACEALYTPERLLELVRQADSSAAYDLRLRLKSEIAKRVSKIDMDFGKWQAVITLSNGFREFVLFQH
jgi:DNA invertase Pin-like site-specific DNA recombinase